jgi:hypothetical protein
MNEQDHAGPYRAAIDAAMDELDFIRHESERLRNQVYQLDTVVEVLKPLIGSVEQTVLEDRRPVSESIEMAAEPVLADEPTLQPAEIELPQLVPQKKSQSRDPIQRRIDSILGLAVAESVE